MSEFHSEYCFPFFTISDLNVVVCIGDIQLCEPFCSSNLILDFIDQWKWIIVFDHDCIQRLVINVRL
jgi:hypothetical protein